MKTAIAVVFTIALAASFSNANACTCGPNYPPPLTALAQSDAVFSGTVALINLSSSPDYYDVYFIVNLYWKGSVSIFQKINTAVFDGACGFYFEVNHAYLVYAYDAIGTGLATDICTRTRSMSFAQEDLDALGPGIPVPVEEVSWGMVKSRYME